MRYIVAVLLSNLLFAGVSAACNFQTEPVAIDRYYRNSGWTLPGVKDGRILSPHIDFLGLMTRDIAHTPPYIAQFPSQEFEQNGAHRRILASLLKVENLVRYESNGKIVAYTYRFTPVSGHREGKKWVIAGEAACEFFATYIDVKGDGVFQLLIPDVMRPEFVPQWARPPQS